MSTVELGHPRPRAVGPSELMRATKVAIPIAYMLVCAFCWLVASRHIGHLEALRDHGVATNALVVAAHTTTGKETKFLVQYEFQAGSRTVTNEVSVPRSVYEDLAPNEMLPVVYLPENPEEHELEAVGQDWVDRVRDAWTLGLAALTGVAAIAYGLLLGTYRMQYDLVASGTYVPATIIPERENSDTPAGSGSVRYVFTPRDGRERLQTISVGESDALAKSGNVVPYFYRGSSVFDGALLPELKLIDVEEATA